MALLFIAYAAAMGIATFIENDYGTPAKVLVYNAWWFEVIMALFVVNFLVTSSGTNSIKEKWATLIFHAAFVNSTRGWRHATFSLRA